jgi:hypothetical protein
MKKDTNVYDYNFHLIPKEEKDAAWGLAYFKSKFPTMSTINGYNADLLNTIRLYGMSKQPESIYKKMFNPQGYMSNGTATKQNDYTGLQWNILSPLKKYKDIVISNITSKIEVECNAIDEIANNQRQKDKLLLKLKKQTDDYLAQISKRIKLPSPMKSNFVEDESVGKEGLSEFKDIDFDFSNDVELQMYMDIYYKQSVEIANEMCINTIFALNEIDNIFDEIRNDMLDFGVAAIQPMMDNNTCMPKFKWLQIANILVGGGIRKDYKDIEYWAYNELATVNQLIGMLGKKLTPDDVREIFKYGVITNGYYQNGVYNTNWSNGVNGAIDFEKVTRYDYDQVKVGISYFAFKSQNYETTEYAKTKYGTTKAKKRKSDYKKENGNKESEVKQEWGQVVYKGYYILGMDKVYDFGLLNNMVRKEGQEELVMLDIIIQKASDKSFTELCIPLADGIQLAFLKLQLELLKSIPSGFAFSIDRLAEIAFGDSGKMSQLEVMRMFTQTGNFPYKELDEDGNPIAASGAKPIDRLPNGVSESINGYIMSINFYTQQIEMMIGYNQVTAGQLPAPRTSAAATNIAAEASGHAVRHLSSAINNMVKNLATYTGSLIQDMASYGGAGWESMKDMIGESNMNVIKSMDKIALHRFNIFCVEKLNKIELEQFKQFVMAAYQKQEIDLADVLLVWFLNDYKQAVALFNIKRKKQMALAQQSQMAQMQQQQQMMAAQAQLTQAMAQLEAQTKLQSVDMRGKFDVAIEQMKQEGRLQATQIQGANKDQMIKTKGNEDLKKELLKQ